MWARAAVLEWPMNKDDIHREFFSDQPYTHLYIHPIFFNETHSSVRWTYTFLDMGMEFVIDKSFFISNDGIVSGMMCAINPTDLKRLVFDHYSSYVENLRHLDHLMSESMEQ